MASTFINPVVNPDKALGVNPFLDTSIVRRWPTQSKAEIEGVIRAIYKQILSNAYVMESERQAQAESQFKRGKLSVAEFIRQVAKSNMYRARFFENGPRNRFIELNFKHFLGRAPQNRAEIAYHSTILDSEGYDAEIDAYLDSDEYYRNFGTDTVPFYRGYKTEASTPMGFTHMFSLLRGASSSDKHVTENNPARLTKTLLADQASPISTPSGATNRKGLSSNPTVEELLRNVFSRPTMVSPTHSKPAEPALNNSELSEKVDAQAEQIEQLKRQIAELRSLSNMGAAILRKGQNPAMVDASAAGPTNSYSMQAKVKDQAKEIERLQDELMSARSLSTIAEFKLNKWRQRSY
ncbi:MAG: phycobilisome rod-core linker polypeptide [Cyanobacteria bacterium J06623_4]